MRLGRAARELGRLRDQAASSDVRCDGLEHQAWMAEVAAVMRRSLGRDSVILQKLQEVRFDLEPYLAAQGKDAVDAWDFDERVKYVTLLIDLAIHELDLYTSDDGSGMASRGFIFVVHGHNDARKYELMRLLDRVAALRAIVLHEEANKGGTILEKFEMLADSTSFAVVLLTGDDEGHLRKSEDPLAPRGRQNVIFELGVFYGLLGRSRVVILKDPDVEEPSDLHGLVYIPLDEAGAWRTMLLKELDAAGIKVDYSHIP